jgi:hypothetical protein
MFLRPSAFRPFPNGLVLRLVAVTTLALSCGNAMAATIGEPPAPVARILAWRDVGVRIPLPWAWRVQGGENGAWRIYPPQSDAGPAISITIAKEGLDEFAASDPRFHFKKDKGVWYAQYSSGRIEATPISGGDWTGVYAEQTCRGTGEASTDARQSYCVTAYVSNGHWSARLETDGSLDAQQFVRDLMPQVRLDAANTPGTPEWPPVPLAAALLSLGVPENARIDEWAGVPDRTLAAWAEPDREVQSQLQLHVLVVSSSNGNPVARATFGYTADDALGLDGLNLFAADLALAPGKPSFAIDFSRSHSGCTGSELKTRSLFELEGSELRLLLDEATTHARTIFCNSDETSETNAAIEPGQTRHAGHVDLVVDEESTANRCNAHGVCRDLAPRRSRHVLRFDGESYVREPDSPGRIPAGLK